MKKMSKQELSEKKLELKTKWEGCFGKTIEEVFKEHTLKKFWAHETSLDEAEAMLDRAALHLAICAMKGDVLGAIIMIHEAINEPDEEKQDETDEPDFFADEEDKKSCFKVFNKSTNTFDSKTFKTYNGADDRRTEIALETSAKINELKVVQVFE